MALTIRQMLKIPELEGFRVLAGWSGMDRTEIRTVTVMDAPDVLQWLHGGEFFLSSGYIFRGNPNLLIQIIEDLHKGGAAGFGLKVNRFLGQIPAEVLVRAEELGFPLIDVPKHFSFSDIINPVLSRLVNQQAKELAFSETVRHSFFDLVMHGAGVEEIMATLARFTHRDVAFYDIVFGELYPSRADGLFFECLRELSLQDLLKKHPSETISLENRTYGYILIEGDTPPEKSDSWEVALDHARTALLLAIQREIARGEAERRYRDEFVLDILSHNVRYEGEVWNRSRLFGWDLSGRQVVAVVDIDNYKHQYDSTNVEEILARLEDVKKRIYNISRSVIRSRFPDTPFTEMSDSIVFILPLKTGAEDPFRQELRKCLGNLQKEVLERTHFSVTVGVGGIKESIFLCHESYGEARKGLEMIRTTVGDGHLVFWKDLGIFKLLGGVAGSPQAEAFYQEYLGPLLNLDLAHKGELLKTLEALVRNNWQLKAAARELEIHYNTIKYRYARICELLDLNLADSDQRLNVALSLKMYLIDKLKEFY